MNEQRLQILVAEDSPTQAELLHECLTAKGHCVTVVGNGVAAVQAAQRIRPALIITDVVMPDMDGYQLCRAIKADPGLRDIPVMIVTALREIEDIVMALECGADHLIRKPFEPDGLLARVEYLLANRKLRAHSKLEFGVDITLGGTKHRITAEREQILDLLFSSYEEALQANQDLRKRQQEIQALNLQLAGHAVDLEEANKQLRSFSHTVSHDLKAPLATISGFCGILEHRYAASLEGEAKRYLGGIHQEARRMVRIVEDILYLANIDRAQVVRSEVDLAAMAAELMERMREGDPARQVEFECPAAALAHCDERLVRIALANLLGNAWKFSARQPAARIRFTLEETDGERVFCVRDNGAGFDARYADRLFKPFERLHTNEEFEGFGVGLVTVQRIVGLHQGRIWAESILGQGATFCFTLGAKGRDRIPPEG